MQNPGAGAAAKPSSEVGVEPGTAIMYRVGVLFAPYLSATLQIVAQCSS
jgi:hypothetical protein